jgi:hypothetical protein
MPSNSLKQQQQQQIKQCADCWCTFCRQAATARQGVQIELGAADAHTKLNCVCPQRQTARHILKRPAAMMLLMWSLLMMATITLKVQRTLN